MIEIDETNSHLLYTSISYPGLLLLFEFLCFDFMFKLIQYTIFY